MNILIRNLLLSVKGSPITFIPLNVIDIRQVSIIHIDYFGILFTVFVFIYQDLVLFFILKP